MENTAGETVNASSYILKFVKMPIINIDMKLNLNEIIIIKAETIVKRNTFYEVHKPAIERINN